jgi:hypothetical protein
MKVCKLLLLLMLVFLLFQSANVLPPFDMSIKKVEGQTAGRRLYIWMQPTSEGVPNFNEYFLTPPYYAGLELVLTSDAQMEGTYVNQIRDLALQAEAYPAIEIMVNVAFADNSDDWAIFGSFLDTLQGITSIYSVGMDAEHWGWNSEPPSTGWAAMTLAEKNDLMSRLKTQVEARGFNFVSYYFGASASLPFLEIGATNYPCPPDEEYTLDWDVSEYHVGQDAGLYHNHDADGSPHWTEDIVMKIIQHGLGIIGDNQALKDDTRRHFIGFCPGTFDWVPAWKTDLFRQWVINQQAPYLGTGPNQIRRAIDEAPPPPPGEHQINLRVFDWDLTDSIQGAHVYMNNGTQFIKISDNNGWANWTYVSGLVQIKVKYYGFWVNGTFSVNVDSDKTINVRCKLYDVTVTVKPNNQQGVITTVNVSVFNSTSVLSNKITSGITANWTGAVTLKNLPNNSLTFTVYAKSDYSVVIANTTQIVSSDGQSFNIVADQNYGSGETSWGIFVFVGLILSQSREVKRKREVKIL